MSLDLVYLTPSRMTVARTPTRSAWLLMELARRPEVGRVTAVNRLRPSEVPSRLRATRIVGPLPLPSLESRLPGGRGAIDRVLEHPWPFGPLEDRFIRVLAGRAVQQAERHDATAVLWVADPKSAAVFDALAGRRERPLLVLDAFDAWDRSPLVTGSRRLRAVEAGYAAAARSADVIFANTPSMVDRFVAAGARDVRLVPNASPRPQAIEPDTEPFLAYVGRVHERFDAPLLAAVARAEPGLGIRIAGPVEHAPAGWDELAACPNVTLLGPVSGADGLTLMGRSRAVVVPHVPDDYTRSQDSMKAWDAMAVGAPVVSTSVPPASGWADRPELARVADDAPGFIAAVRAILAEDPAAGREARRSFAAANGWDARAAEVSAVLEAAAGALRSSGGR